MRAAIYARFSSDRQSDRSIEDQVRLCHERIVREGWTLAQTYTDRAISGASLLRPGIQGLIDDVMGARIDVIVAEALDRLSRDQADVAGLFKRLAFASVRLVTLSEGEINELHVGLKGTMNQLFLKDLADKTRRGLRGRVEAGRSGGGRSYAYVVVPGPAQSDGLPERGLRRIDPVEADVVRRIFREYAVGRSARKIAQHLNLEGIRGPSGRTWGTSTIAGNAKRGTGILNNELYIGRLVWNRLRYIREPTTGRRVSRPNEAASTVVKEVPELRIIDDELWQAVKERQAKMTIRRQVSEGDKDGFWNRRRPRYLLSGLMRCSVCGGGFSKISATHFGCSTARNKGTCDNRLSIRRDVVESTVLDALRNRLMDPELYAVFVNEFTAEYNRLNSAEASSRRQREAELQGVRAKIQRIVKAVEDGLYDSSMKQRMSELQARRQELESELAQAGAPAPMLHPKLADIYRSKITSLQGALDAGEGEEVRGAIRALIEAVVLVPENGRLAVEVRGDLAAMLQLASGDKVSASRAFAEQVKMVAGVGFEPTTFRL